MEGLHNGHSRNCGEIFAVLLMINSMHDQASLPVVSHGEEDRQKRLAHTQHGDPVSDAVISGGEKVAPRLSLDQFVSPEREKGLRWIRHGW